LVADDYAGNGLWALQDPKDESGVIKVFFSRTSPKELDLGRAYGWSFSSDRRFSLVQTGWSTQTGLGNVVAVNNTTLERCTFQSKLNARVWDGVGFSPNGTWALWSETVSSTFSDLWIGNPNGCGEVHLVGHASSQEYMADTRGLLYIDEATQPRAGRLQYRAWAPGGGWSDRPPVLIHPSVDMFQWPGAKESIIAFISTDPALVGFYVVEIPQQ
jgi:hypothetical protein